MAWGHHSNGESDPFYVRDSITNEQRINVESSNFSTNFAYLGYLHLIPKRNNRAVQSAFEGTFRYHVALDWTKEQDKLLDQYRLAGRWISFTPKSANKAHRFSLMAQLELQLQHISVGMLSEGRSFGADLRFAWKPPLLSTSSFWFFAQGYFGSDYYNIRFMEQAQFLRIGISAQPALPRFFKNK